MTVLSWTCLGFGTLGVAFGARCYLELWRWAKQCQRAHIVVAYNRRVLLNASLSEWLGWVNQLKGEDANGRVVLNRHKMSVSIIKRSTTAKTKTNAVADTVRTLRRSRRSRKDQVTA